MRANKTTLEKAVTVLRLLEGGEETYATAESTQKKSGLVAGPSRHAPAQKLAMCKRRQELLYQPGNKKMKILEPESKPEGIWLKVCLMRLKRLKYERKSTLKSCYVNLSSTWSEVKSKIASAFDLNITTLLEEASLIVADSELVEDESVPTLQKYLHNRKSGLGRTVFGLYIPAIEVETSSYWQVRSTAPSIKKPQSKSSGISRCKSTSLQPSISTTKANKGKSKGKSRALPSVDLHCNEAFPIAIGSESSSSSIASIDEQPQKPESIKKLCLMMYSATELKRATNNFSKENLIGKGGFGEVYSAELRCSSVAVKILKKNVISQEHTSFIQEMEYLARYRHKHVIQILGVCDDKHNPAYIMEKMENGSLMAHLHKKKDIHSIGPRLRILFEAAQGIAFLHYNGPDAKPLLHLDIKSSNILLDSNMQAKISDFGLAKELPPLPVGHSYARVESVRGSRGYMADEYYDGQLSTKLDVYSFGVVVLETYTGKQAYNPTAECKQLAVAIRDSLYDLNSFIGFRDPEITSVVVPDFEVQQLAKNTLSARHTRINMEKVLKSFSEMKCNWKLW